MDPIYVAQTALNAERARIEDGGEVPEGAMSLERMQWHIDQLKLMRLQTDMRRAELPYLRSLMVTDFS